MARFFGEVGYANSVENPVGSGIWKDVITEYSYYGDVIRNTRKLDSGENLNADISVSNSISVLVDQYAVEHFLRIRYIRWAGTLWTVDNVEVQSPRLILRLGSVYNGPVYVPYSNAIEIIDHGDGTWSAVGGSDRIVMIDSTTFQIIDIDGSYSDPYTYTVSSTPV